MQVRVIDSTVPYIFWFSLAHVGSHVGNTHGSWRIEGIADQSIFFLFSKGLLSIFVDDFFSGDICWDGAVDQVFVTSGDPSQIEYKLPIVIHALNFFGVWFLVGCVHNKGSQNEITLLSSSLTLDEESAVLEDSVKVDLFAIPILDSMEVEVLFDFVKLDLHFSAVSSF